MSTNFKVKNKKIQNEQYRATLDSKHNEMVRYFENLTKSVSGKKKKLKQIDNTLQGLEDCDISPELIAKRLNLQEEKDKLLAEINSIENKEEENKYYLENSELIFQYFDNINELAKPAKPQHQKQISNIDNKVFYEPSRNNLKYKPSKKYKKKDNTSNSAKNICSFFCADNKNENVEDEINDDEEDDDEYKNDAPIKKNFNINDFVERKKNFQRGHIFERFMSRVEPTYNISSQRDENIDICPECGIEKIINYNEGIASCEKCGACDFIKIDCDKRSYKDPPPEMSYFAYKRINHFREWLAQFQAKETTDIPQHVYDTLWLEIKKNRITDMRKIVPTKLREFLKKHKLNKYYEHIPHIIYKLNGVPPPVITKDVEERLCNAFKDIQGPFAKVCPKNRKNFLSYSYVLYKFSQLLELDNLSSGFTLLKSKEKLNNQDQIWRKICQELNWQYIDTVY